MLTEIQTKTFGLGDIFRTAWWVIKSQYRTFLSVCLWIYIPLVLLTQFLNIPTASAETAQSTARFNSSLHSLLASLLGIFVMAGLPYFVERTLQGSGPTWGEVLRFGASRWLSYFGTGLVLGIILGLWSLLLIIPGIIFGVFYIFWVNALVLRNFSGYDALTYSKSLVEGQWWKTFGITIVLFLACYGGMFLVGLLLELIWDSVAVNMLVTLMDYLAGAVLAVMQTVWFLNLDYQKHPSLPPVPLTEAPSAIAVDGYRAD
jgi:hypothetical protein